MVLKTHRFSLTLPVALISILALSGCEDLQGISSLSDLGRKVDPVPGDEPKVQQSAERPQPDSRGVISYPTYKVIVARRGDTMADVAGRVGISAKALADHNGLSENHSLRTGEVLALPKGVGTIAAAPSDNSIEDIASSAIDAAPNTPAAVPAANGDPEPLRHVVEPGETAYSIARLYNVSVTALASWNGLDRNLAVREGQQLLIPVAEISAAPSVAAPAAAQTTQVAAAAVTPKPKPAVLPTSKPGTGTTAPNPPSASKPLPKPVEPAVVPESPKPAAKPTPAPTQTASASGGDRKLLKPVNGKVLRGFSSKPGGNEGIDFGAPTGTDVKAAENGTVALISKSVSDTTIVLIRHPDNLYTVYSNVGSATVKKGDKVSRGQNIGKVAGGNPPFVHFEIRRGTEAVDPTPYL